MNDIRIIDNVRTRLAWRSGYLLAAFGIYLADQATKAWAVRELRFGQDRTVISGFFDFIYTENPGIAFGQLQEGGAFGRWFFVALATAASIAVLFYFCENTTRRRSCSWRVRTPSRRHHRQHD